MKTVRTWWRKGNWGPYETCQKETCYIDLYALAGSMWGMGNKHVPIIARDRLEEFRVVFPQKAGSARSRKHHNEHFHIETKRKDASSNVPQSKLKPKGAWKLVKMTNRQIKYGHLTLKMANFTGCLAPIFDPYPLHEMNLARNRDLQRSFAEN